MFTTNQITLALAAYRPAADQDTRRPRASPPRCSATTPSHKWTAFRTTGRQGGRPNPDPGGKPVEHRAHLQLDAGRELLFACWAPSNFCGVHVRGRQRLRPIVRQLRGRQGAWSMNGVAKLHFGAFSERQERWMFTASRSWTHPGGWRSSRSFRMSLLPS